MYTKGYTKINNSLLFDLNISIEALGLAVKLINLSTRKNFEIRREYIKKLSGMGETAFRRVWAELKSVGIVVVSKVRVKGKFDYTFKVQDSSNIHVAENMQVESNDNTTFEGQTYEEEIVHSESESEVLESKEIDLVSRETGLSKEKSKKLLKVAHYNITKIFEAYEYAKDRSSKKGLFGYIKWAIKNQGKWSLKNEYAAEVNPKGFNNFEAREYDYSDLEEKLLGWKDVEPYLETEPLGLGFLSA